MGLTLSPLAPKAMMAMPVVAGVELATCHSGVRYKDRDDLLLVRMPEGTSVAGVYTRSLTAAAPVDWCRKAEEKGKARALVVNAGHANAYTGRVGDEAVGAMTRAVSELVGCDADEVFVASTGIIGQPLNTQGLIAALQSMPAQMSVSGWQNAAKAIMTTDTFPKWASRTARIGEHVVTINGFCKGSGMIAPDMATLLGFVFTDAALPAPVLRTLLTRANLYSFNSITVDGDTSTNDTILMFATAAVQHPAIEDAGDTLLDDFKHALHELMSELAIMVVRDGEGARKLVKIDVTGAKDDAAARRIAMTIANSPLVKTAIAGEDPNWGRIIGAAGRAGEWLDKDKLALRLGGQLVTHEGGVHPAYSEQDAAAHMKGEEIDVALDVAVGQGSARVWTCDLTHAYIDINADYRS
jgi:glutamate N-acetyltransferase / amino-acid N-acetyltransferase